MFPRTGVRMNSTMTVGKKLTLIGVFLIGLTAVMGISTVLGLKSLNRTVAQLSGDSLDGISESSKVEADLLELRGDAWRHIAADKEGVAAMDVSIQQLKERISANLTAVEKTINSTEERNIFNKTKPAMD